MSFLHRLEPLLDNVSLGISLYKKDGVIHMAITPTGSAGNTEPEYWQRLTPIIMSGTIEELNGATFDDGFAVVNTVVTKMMNAKQVLDEANALEEAAKTKKTNVEKKKTTPSEKALEDINNGKSEEKASSKKKGLEVISSKATPKVEKPAKPKKPAPPPLPEMTRSKYNSLVAQISLGWSGTAAAQKEMKRWSIPEEYQVQLDKMIEENKDRGRPGTPGPLL